MTNWYPYRWVCQKCEAVHWYAPEKCQNCGVKSTILKERNSARAFATNTAKSNAKPKVVDDLVKKILGE